MIVAIMIGRKGSSGLPGKNTIQVSGEPMAAWPLKAATHVTDIQRIYVSTDDPALEELARQYNAQVITRPAILASDEALGEDAFKHAHEIIKCDLGSQGKTVEMYVLLMANAVTITPAQISQGIAKLRSNPDADSAVSVSRYNMWSPLRARRIASHGFLEPFVPFELFGNPATMNCDRDSQGDVWFADMGVSVIRPENLEDLESGLLPQKWMGQRILPIENDGGLDIDYAYQLPQAEFWLKRYYSG